MLKFVGPSFSAKPNLYGRASSLPDQLSVRCLAELASCSLSSPDGDDAIEEQWSRSLVCLAQSGGLSNEKGIVTGQAMREALPLLESEGLMPSGALLKWCGAAAVEHGDKAVVSLVRDMDETGRAVTVQPWARAWQGKYDPLFCVIGGAAKLNTLSNLAENSVLKFATTDLCSALELYKKGTVPQKSQETLSAQLRALYPGFTWAEGNGGADRQGLRRLILDAYAEGKLLVDDDELDTHLPENVLRLRAA